MDEEGTLKPWIDDNFVQFPILQRYFRPDLLNWQDLFPNMRRHHRIFY